MKKYFHIFLIKDLSSYINPYTRNCIKYVTDFIKPYFKYDISFTKNPIIDESSLDKEYEHIFLWDCNMVKTSFHLIENSSYLHVVFLTCKTSIFKNNQSKNEPINENFILFNNMKCIYLNPEKNENSYEYDVIIDDNNYVFDINKIIKNEQNISN